MKDKRRKTMSIMSESEKTARRLLIKAMKENRLSLPEFSEVPLTDKECRDIAKNFPYSMEQIRQIFPEIISESAKLEISNGSELASYCGSSINIPLTPNNIHLYLKDTNGKDCEIDMLELLRVLRSMAPELMDNLWEKARKEVE